MEIPKPTARWMMYWTVAACILLIALAFSALVRRAHAFDGYIIHSAQQNGLSPALVSSVIWKESRYQVDARGEAGEIGLMQVTAGAAADWARAHKQTDFEPEMLWNPVVNIEIGSWYLGRAAKYWAAQDCRDPIPFALAEYNAGRKNAARWVAVAGTQPEAFVEAVTFSTTQAYIRDILNRSRGGL